MKQLYSLIVVLLVGAVLCTASAQLYQPVTVTGFNTDVIAETGASSQAVTATVLDLSDYVLYSQVFASANAIGGGIPNNGYVIGGVRAYQLQPFTGNNVLYLSNNGTVPQTTAAGTLTLTTPAPFSSVSLLVFATEGNSTLSVSLKFTDGTIVNNGNSLVLDWFWGTNAVSSGYGRVTRKTAGPYVPDGLVDPNPRFYPLDIPVACANQTKLLESITVTYVSGTTASVRGAVLAVSGVPYAPLAITPTVTPASCGGTNGSVQLAVTGNTAPYKYAWNTTPVQTTPTASGLAPGDYTCTVTDVNNCTTTFQATIPKTSAMTLSVTPATPAVCAGASITLSATAVGGTASSYNWQPGNESASSITVTPGSNTSYTVTAVDGFGCTATATVPVTVKPVPVAAFTAAPDPVCVAADQTVQFTGTAGSNAVFNWNNFAGATVKSGAGAGPYIIQFNQAGNYNLQLQVTVDGCTSAVTKKEVTVTGPLVMPVITLVTATATSLTFSWLPVPGATAYQVLVNGVGYGTPGTATTVTITGLQPLQTATIEVTALGAMACRNSAIAKSSGKTISEHLFIPNSFTPNGDGRNDAFKVYGGIVAAMEMKIFNQWGELIAVSKDIATGWDGKHRGTIQPMGVYTYVIRLTLTDGSEQIRKGSVNLLR